MLFNPRWKQDIGQRDAGDNADCQDHKERKAADPWAQRQSGNECYRAGRQGAAQPYVTRYGNSSQAHDRKTQAWQRGEQSGCTGRDTEESLNLSENRRY